MMASRRLNIFLLLTTISTCASSARLFHLTQNQLFAIRVDSATFNWTQKRPYQFDITLENYPDLPTWIQYNNNNNAISTQPSVDVVGYLFGVPKQLGKFNLDVVGLCKNSYETRVEKLQLIVEEPNGGTIITHEVNMKIDNLNVEDLLENGKLEAIKTVFQDNLWKQPDELTVTFMRSALDLGARKPVNPQAREGVVLRLGSTKDFSIELLELQEEVRPLYKMQNNCPRDFKRTSVERLFRDAGFVLDWCSFKLIHWTQPEMEFVQNSDSDIYEKQFFGRQAVPTRWYRPDLVATIVTPTVIMTVLVAALSFLLCFVNEDSCESDQVVMTPSPTFRIKPQQLVEVCNGGGSASRGMHCRPVPPPYVKPHPAEL